MRLSLQQAAAMQLLPAQMEKLECALCVQGNLYGWEVFMDQIQALAASVPYMLNLGNHERE